VRVVHLSTIHPALDVRIFYKECRTLAAGGHSVHLLAANPPGPFQDGVHFHRFEPPLLRFRPGRIGRRLARIYRRAAKLRADLYHFHDPELIPIGVLLARTGAKVVYDVHEDAPQEALTLNKARPLEGRCKSLAWRALEEIAKRTLHAFVCATPAIARRFPASRTITLLNYPRKEEFLNGSAAKATGHLERPRHVAYVGAIADIRGIREMVRALELLPQDSDIRLLLAGRFASPQLQAEVERMPGWRRVNYLGWQPREEMRKILAQARAGLVLFHPEPDHFDAQPNKLFEYMAMGLPVIASDFPQWREFVTRVGCGTTVDPLNPAAIARAITQVIGDPYSGEGMGRLGKLAIAGHYNWEAEAGKLLDLYQVLEQS
jgi:glycosyltransferase involved in cell wall biosynthesis